MEQQVLIKNLTERVIKLEQKITFQDNDLEELNKVLFEQQQIIYKLETQYKQLLTKLTALQISNLILAPFNEEERPPHY